MLRNVIAVIIGIIAGMALNMGILEINSLAYPIPEGLDIKVPAQLQNYLDTLPAPAFLVAMAAPLAQSFGGGWVAARLGSSRPMLLAMIVGMISLVAGAVMQVDIMTFEYIGYGGTLSFLAILSILLHLGAAWRAGFIEQKRRAAAETPSTGFAETTKAE